MQYTIKLPLVVNEFAEKQLKIRFHQAGCQLYNAVLGESLKRVNWYKKLKKPADELYKELKSKKPDEMDKVKRMYEEAEIKTGFYFRSAKKYGRDNSIGQFAAQTRNACWIKDHLGAKSTTALAERAFKAVEKMVRGTGRKINGFNQKAKKVSFKRTKDGLGSITGVGDGTLTREIIWKENHVLWNNIRLPVILNKQDEFVSHFIETKPLVCCVAIRRLKVDGKISYWAHLSVDGEPLQKEKNILGKGIVGVDLGPNKLVAFSEEGVLFERFDKIISYQKEIKKLQKKISRVQRLHNPNNFEADFKDKHGRWRKGKVKKGRKNWVVSKRQQLLYDKVADLRRREAELRRCKHGIIANKLRKLGNKLHIENNTIKQWQQDKKFSRMVTRYAPATLVCLLENKFKFTEGEVIKIDTYSTKLSQTCPCCLKQKKKSLSERMHICECGCVMDRDVASAFLAYCCDEQGLQASKVKKLYKEYGTLLETACDQNKSVTEEGFFFDLLQGRNGLPQNDTEVLKRDKN